MSSHNTNNCLQRILKHYTLLIFKNKYKYKKDWLTTNINGKITKNKVKERKITLNKLIKL